MANYYPDEVIEEIIQLIGKGENRQINEASFTPRSKKVLELASQEANQLKSNYIDTEHILLGLIKESSGIAVRILIDLGVNLDNLYSEIMKIQTNRTKIPINTGKPPI